MVVKVLHFVHSIDPKNGGVAEAVVRLNEEFNHLGVSSEITENPSLFNNQNLCIIAHGLWQWPSHQAYINYRKKNIPYLVFPHGMLDPWFKKTYKLKHIKNRYIGG